MKTITIEVPEELAAEMHELLQQRLRKSMHETLLLEAQLKKFSSSFVQSMKGEAAKREPVVAAETPKLRGLVMPTARQSREAVKKMVLETLKSYPASGMGVSALQKTLGTRYSTTFRALRDLAAEKKVESYEGKWTIAVAA